MATNTGQYIKGSGISMYGTPSQQSSGSMMSTGNQSTSGLLSSIRNTQAMKEQEKQRIETAQSTQRSNDTVSLYGQSLMSTSEPLKKQYSVSSRGSELASMIVEMGKEKGITYTGNDKEVIDSYLKQNPGQSKALYDFTHGNIDAEAFANQMKWLQEDNQLMTPAPWLNDTSVGIAGAGLGAVGVDRLGALMEWGGDKIYKMPIDSSINESKKIQASKVSLKDAEAELKSAKSKLSAAKKSGKGVKEAQQLVDLAEIKVKAAKGTKVRTVADSAKAYNVGGGIIEGWTDQSRGVQAKHEANQIFKETIEPALEKSTAKVNVQNLINELSDDVERLAKNDPDKLEAYKSALEDLKKSYKSKEFAEYSLKDAQTLKSGLQGRTPQKFWKGKEITNELQELKGILSTKLKNKVHANLSKELGENSAKLYLDYANLTDYAKTMAKQSTNAGMKGGFGGFTNSLYHKLTDGAFAKVGLTLDNGGKLLQRPRKILSDGIKYISKNFKKVFKPSTAGKLRVTDPVGMLQLIQVGGELWDSMLGGDTSLGNISEAIGEIPVIQAYDIMGEMEDFRKSWNLTDDNGRVDILLETLGEGYSREEAEIAYEAWKKLQGSEDGQIRGGMEMPTNYRPA